MSKRRAVITGIGPITCIGIGREEFWRGLRAEKSGIRTIASFDIQVGAALDVAAGRRATATPLRDRSGDASRRLLAWRLCVRLTAAGSAS